MSTKDSDHSFRFGLKHLLRLIIFVIVYYFLINYLTTNPTPSTNLNLNPQKLSQFIPSDSQAQLSKLNQHPLLSQIQQQLNGFPQKQLKDFQIWLIREVSKSIINNLEGNGSP